MKTEANTPKDILGIESEIIIMFLKLIRDKYPSVDKANYFLEKSGMSGINIAIVNQRDALSHLCTLLVDKSLTRDERIGQVYAAEEHLRRAVLESYQKGLALKLLSIQELYNKYKNEVIPYQKSHQNLSSAPEIKAISDALKEIDALGEKGRSVKGRNRWDDEWEDGVNHYLKAFIKSEELEDLLENYLALASQIPKQINKKIKLLISTVIISILLNLLFLIIFLV